MIVEPDCLLGGLCALGKRDKSKFETIFKFKNAVDAFSQGIVVTIAHLAHARAHQVLAKELAIGMAGVLHAMVTVVD